MEYYKALLGEMVDEVKEHEHEMQQLVILTSDAQLTLKKIIFLQNKISQIEERMGINGAERASIYASIKAKTAIPAI